MRVVHSKRSRAVAAGASERAESREEVEHGWQGCYPRWRSSGLKEPEGHSSSFILHCVGEPGTPRGESGRRPLPPPRLLRSKFVMDMLGVQLQQASCRPIEGNLGARRERRKGYRTRRCECEGKRSWVDLDGILELEARRDTHGDHFLKQELE